MKCFLIICAVLMLAAVSMQAQENSPYSIITTATVVVNDELSYWSGGFVVGGRAPITTKDGLGINGQITYARLNWSPDAPLQIVQPTLVTSFDIGNQWVLETYLGAQVYVNGQNSDVDLSAGLGFTRTIWTFKNSKPSPGGLDLLGQLFVVDADGNGTGDYWQTGLGLQINIPR